MHTYRPKAYINISVSVSMHSYTHRNLVAVDFAMDPVEVLSLCPGGSSSPWVWTAITNSFALSCDACIFATLWTFWGAGICLLLAWEFWLSFWGWGVLILSWHALFGGSQIFAGHQRGWLGNAPPAWARRTSKPSSTSTIVAGICRSCGSKYLASSS